MLYISCFCSIFTQTSRVGTLHSRPKQCKHYSWNFSWNLLEICSVNFVDIVFWLRLLSISAYHSECVELCLEHVIITCHHQWWWHVSRCDVVCGDVAVLSKNNKTAMNTFILKPYVHFLSDDAACIAYIRLTQYLDRSLTPRVSAVFCLIQQLHVSDL